jgi:hypothetical protein
VSDVTSEAELTAAINAANESGAGAALAPIVLGQDIALDDALPALRLAPGVTLTIESATGQDYAIDGVASFQGLVIDSGDVTLSSIQLNDDLVTGAAGTGGDGGGPGLGGGLFVGSGATVTLDDVNFFKDRAVGGAGGTGNVGSLGQGGNLGLGGLGGQGGTGGKPYSAEGLGGFGGGGGGGSGGQGGRGGAETILPNPMGTGDGTPVFLPGTSGMAGGEGGKGGFGGGGGGDGAHGAGSQGPVGGTGGQAGGGGGGLGAGGDVFVQSGGKLLIEGGTLTGGSATGGQGGAGGSPGATGQGYGSGIFLQGTSAIVFDPSTTQSIVLDDVIADMTGSKDASGLTGALTLGMNGPGSLTLNNAGDTFSGGVQLDGGTLTLGSATAAGSGNIVFGGTAGIAAQLSLANAAQVFTGTFINALVDFGANDSIHLSGLQYTGAGPYEQITVNSDALTVTENNQTETFTLLTPSQETFYAESDGSGGTVISAACYVAGTHILTGRGEIPIETLSPGDFVVTASGRRRPVAWIGHRRIDVARHPDPAAVRPVRILAGAFGEGLPRRDLWLSPGHSVACAGSLIPISCLINGRSVAQVEVDRVDYWHVELDAHDVILAEGLPAESYLDTGNRKAFNNGDAFVEAHPRFEPKYWNDTCLPMALEGPAVIATKARLLARLAAESVTLTNDADAHVEIDGLRVEPIRLNKTRLAFALPAGGRQIALQSRLFVPAHCLAQSLDPRQLGLCVGVMQIDGEPLELEDDEQCASGWHEAERVGERFSHRWTAGSTPLPAGARLVILDLAGVGYFWRNLRENKAALFA